MPAALGKLVRRAALFAAALTTAAGCSKAQAPNPVPEASGDPAASAEAVQQTSQGLGTTGTSTSPLPRARLLRKAALVLTGAYPAPADLERAASGELDVDAAIEQLLSSDRFLDIGTGWLYEWLQIPFAYRYFRAGETTIETAELYGFYLNFFQPDSPTSQLYRLDDGSSGPNPYYIPRIPGGLFDHSSPAFGRVMTMVRDAYAEPAMIFRQILAQGDARDLVRGNWSIRSPALEAAYLDRDRLGNPDRMARNLSSIATPVSDPLAARLGGPDGSPGLWYNVPSLRGGVGILGTIAFLNRKMNGRTRSNLVARSFLCRDIPISDTTGWTPPPPCSTDDDPRCADTSHAKASCAQCHISLDPLARLWERYQLDFASDHFWLGGAGMIAPTYTTDPRGRYIDGHPPRYDDGTPVSGLDGLGAMVAADPSFANCMVDRIFVKIAGRKLTSPDDDALRARLVAGYTQAYSIKTLVRAIVASPAFRNR